MRQETLMTNNKKIDLCREWKLNWADGQRGGHRYAMKPDKDTSRWLDATVPGEIHLDLIKAGIIEEPTKGSNFLNSRWVEEYLWTYRKDFELSEDEARKNAVLIFEGLDYCAVIYLNGVEIGRHANYYYPCRLDASGKLIAGKNTIAVQLESGLYDVAEKQVSGFFNATESEDMLLHKRIWQRKPQCSFEWDWSPRYINVGIHKPVCLELFDSVSVESVSVTATLDDTLSSGKISARAFVQSRADNRPLLGKIRVRECDRTVEKEFLLSPGQNTLEWDMEIQNPNLWWPIGYGDQNLYAVTVELYDGGALLCETRKEVGFRYVEVNQSPHPECGNYFIFEINHQKVFMKGANLVPADIIFARIDSERYRTLVERAAEANFNMLRVWGGGLYESDDFYSLCNQRGILVWQEFIFACAGYPADDPLFVKSVREEAVYNIRRLSHHPSLVAWCGNNENECLTWDREEGAIAPDYFIYHKLLPQLIKAEDPGRYYQPSSPYSPDGRFANEDESGDQHPWSIGFENIDFYQYRDMICRFPNEGGILGPCSRNTVLECLDPDQANIHSFAWDLHDNMLESFYEKSSPDNLIKFWLGTGIDQLSVDEYIYAGGLVQSEGLGEYIYNFRRRKWDSSSAIFWMYNDCWPATRSWTIVDHRLNRNPAFYPVKRAFSPVAVVLTIESETVRVWGVNDTLRDIDAKLQFGVFELSGQTVLANELEAHLPTNASTCLAEFPARLWEDTGFERSIAFASLSDGSGLLCRNRLFLKRYLEMNWDYSDEIDVYRDGDYAVFYSKTFIWGICLDLDGLQMPDNFFDLWPEAPYRIEWPKEKPLPQPQFWGNRMMKMKG